MAPGGHVSGPKRPPIPPYDELPGNDWTIPVVPGISEKIKAGIEAARQSGVRIGAPQKFDRRRLAGLVMAGWSDSEIARELGAHPRSIQRIRRSMFGNTSEGRKARG